MSVLDRVQFARLKRWYRDGIERAIEWLSRERRGSFFSFTLQSYRTLAGRARRLNILAFLRPFVLSIPI